MKKRVLTAAVCVALLLSILPVKAQAADYTATGTIATLTFRLAEDALPGTYPITLTCRDTLNYNLDDVAFTAVGSQITIRETAPTEILALSVLEVTPERATVRLTAEQDRTLVVALYTMDNKLMDVRLASISGGSGEQEIPVSISSGGLRIFTARAFLLDGTFCRPACQKYEVCIDRTVD